MVKKFIFLLTFLFITLSFNLDVNAMPLGYPTVFPRYFDTIGTPQTATLADWWSTDYYVSPFLLGLTSTTSGYNQIDFNWFNANLCPNDNLHISGSIGGLYTLFYKSPTIAIYNNSQRMNCTFSEPLDSGSRITFNCSGVGGGNLSIYIQQNNPDFEDTYAVGVTRDFDVRCEATNNDIINNQNANTQNIINNQNQNTNTITQNQDTNTQNIINNQNQNTQDVIDNQNANTDKEIESQKVCSSVPISIDNKLIDPAGTVQPNYTAWGVTDYLNIEDLKITETQINDYASYCFYTDNKTKISCKTLNTLQLGELTNVPNNSKYVRFSIDKRVNRPKIVLCQNGNQALSDDLNHLNDSITSDTPPDTENQLNDLDNSLISDTPITDLITLPITLINSYITGFGGSCSPYNLGNLYGTDLILPCLNLEQRLGSNLWTIIDSLFSIFMIYNIAMLMIQAFEGFTSLRDDYEGLYQPRHADVGYQPKHGGGN